jgi:prepilin-type N-terminal cleavage/methylation domain-containing protein
VEKNWDELNNFMRFISKNKKNERGFNLIELMIVIAIIALLIGVGVPAWQSMVRSGNETTAAQTLRTIGTLQAQYASKHQGKFAKNFDELIKSVSLDDRYKGDSPAVNGYVFKLTANEGSASGGNFYSVTAEPQAKDGLSSTGTRNFYFDSNLSTIRFTENGEPAVATSPSI